MASHRRRPQDDAGTASGLTDRGGWPSRFFATRAAKPNYACASAFPELLDGRCAEGIEGAGIARSMTPSPAPPISRPTLGWLRGNWPPEPMRCHPIVPAPQLDRKLSTRRRLVGLGRGWLGGRLGLCRARSVRHSGGHAWLCMGRFHPMVCRVGFCSGFTRNARCGLARLVLC